MGTADAALQVECSATGLGREPEDTIGEGVVARRVWPEN